MLLFSEVSVEIWVILLIFLCVSNIIAPSEGFVMCENTIPDKVGKIRKNVSGLMNVVEDLKAINTNSFIYFVPNYV